MHCGWGFVVLFEVFPRVYRYVGAARGDLLAERGAFPVDAPNNGVAEIHGVAAAMIWVLQAGIRAPINVYADNAHAPAVAQAAQGAQTNRAAAEWAHVVATELEGHLQGFPLAFA